MANVRGGQDLLKLVGAKVVSIEVNGRPMNHILIPAAWNEIEIHADGQGKPKSAFLNWTGWETNAKFRQACVDRNTDKENYVAPSHEISVHYSEKFTEAARASAEKRLRADAAFMQNHPSDEEIKKQARYDVNARQRIGYITPMQPKAATPYTSAAPAAPNMGGFTAAADDGIDELPF